MRARAVVAGVGGQAEFEVGVEGVAAALLEFVRSQLGQQADAAPLVAAEVDDDAAALLGDAPHGRLQLGSAVAAQRVEDVAGEALGVQPGEDVLALADVAVDEGDVFDAVDGGAVAVRREVAEGGGQPDLGLAADGGLRGAAVGDQVLDGDDRQAVLAGEGDQLRQAEHLAVLARDLHDGAGGAQARETGEVDGGLGVAVAGEDAAGAGAQREDVPGAHEVVGRGRAAREEPQGGGAVVGGDAGGDAVRGGGVDGDGEAVLIDSVLFSTICGSRSRSSSSASMGAQIRPRHSLIMKATISGVAFSAAMTRSPSFSRSSSSTTTTGRPAAMSRTACSTGSRERSEVSSLSAVLYQTGAVVMPGLLP